jgi:hypothetical protein
MALHIKTYGSVFSFVPVGCGEVPKYLAKNTQRLIHPRYSRLPVLAPKTGYVQNIARRRAAGCGVVQSVEVEGWTAEDFAERGCCGSVVTVAFFASSFLFVRPVDGGGGELRGRTTYVQSCNPMPPTPMHY